MNIEHMINPERIILTDAAGLKVEINGETLEISATTVHGQLMALVTNKVVTKAVFDALSLGESP